MIFRAALCSESLSRSSLPVLRASSRMQSTNTSPSHIHTSLPVPQHLSRYSKIRLYPSAGTTSPLSCETSSASRIRSSTAHSIVASCRATWRHSGQRSFSSTAVSCSRGYWRQFLSLRTHIKAAPPTSPRWSGNWLASQTPDGPLGAMDQRRRGCSEGGRLACLS